jgi:hypothetical protein
MTSMKNFEEIIRELGIIAIMRRLEHNETNWNLALENPQAPVKSGLVMKNVPFNREKKPTFEMKELISTDGTVVIIRRCGQTFCTIPLNSSPAKINANFGSVYSTNDILYAIVSRAMKIRQFRTVQCAMST